MSSHQITQGSVVVGMDGSASSHSALRWAVAEAQRTQRPLHVVHALESETVVTDKHQLGTKEAPKKDDTILLAALDVVVAMAPEVPTTAHSVTGFAATTLIAASKIAETVVVGSHGRGAVPTALLGSVSQQVAIHSSSAVVVVRENAAPVAGKGHVVVGVDGSEASKAALTYGFAHAASTGSSLTAVHTWWWEPLEGVSLGEPWIGDWTEIANQEQALVSGILASYREKYPDVPVRSHVVRGDPVFELLGQSAGASLLVVGSRGRGGLSACCLAQ